MGEAAANGAVALYKPPMAGVGASAAGAMDKSNPLAGLSAGQGHQLAIRKGPSMPKPTWHAPWKLFRVISGHMGWVRCCAIEPGNEWFATGAADRVIKIWDLASGKLKVSLTGHVSVVRGLAVSNRQPYLFSCGEDRQVKCWDLEYNKVIRHYHGHLSAVYDLALHPTLDVLVQLWQGLHRQGLGHEEQGEHPHAGRPHEHRVQRALSGYRPSDHHRQQRLHGSALGPGCWKVGGHPDQSQEISEGPGGSSQAAHVRQRRA